MVGSIKKGPEKIGEEIRVEISEEEEGGSVVPRREEKVRDCGWGSGMIEGVVVRENVVEEKISARGEESGGRRREGVAEEREEFVVESMQPVGVVVLEWESHF